MKKIEKNNLFKKRFLVYMSTKSFLQMKVVVKQVFIFYFVFFVRFATYLANHANSKMIEKKIFINHYVKPVEYENPFRFVFSIVF